ERATNIRPVFEGCKPPSNPTEQASIGAPDKTAQYLARRAKEARNAYTATVQEILSNAQDETKVAHDSPILEQMQAISRYHSFQGQSRGLTVITDGLQNTRIAQFCQAKGHMPLFSTFQKREAYREVAPRGFDDVNVKFNLVGFGELPSPSLPYCTNVELQSWWKDYFFGHAAAAVEMTALRFWSGE
ncbi:MAG: hypothetical protein AAF986_04205, partial [Pseudomonadota bacterium]